MQNETNNYNNIEALNQSLLKKISSGPRSIVAPEKESTDSLTIGSLVDDMICDPESVHDKYVVCTIEMPSDTIVKIIERVLLSTNDLNLENLDEQILESCEYYQYQSNWKPETKVAKIKKEGLDYFNFRKNTANKQVISAEIWLLADDLKNTLTTDRYTKQFFETNLESQYQFVATGEIEGQLCKGKLDKITFDHDNKVIHIYDIKTTSDSVNAFRNSYLKYRYDIQGEFYKKLVEQMYPDYTVNNMIFIVGSYAYRPLEVRCFQMTDLDHKNAYEGFNLNNRHFKGIKELIQDYIWYITNQEFEYPKDYIEQNGMLKIDIVTD